MANADAGRDSGLAVLLVGLFSIAVLQSVAILAVTAHAALGLGVGLLEILLAWRVSVSRSARVLRLLLAVFGAVTVAVSVFVWAAGAR